MRETIKGLRVLVVDDEATSRSAISDQLRACGIQAVCVGTAQDALQELVDATVRDQPFEVALIDYHLPECDGEQLSRLIRTYDHLTHTRLILLTGASVQDEGRLAQLGIAGGLAKPTSERHLAACLAKVMNARSAAANESENQDGLIDLATARVVTISAYRAILRLLKEDPALIRQLGPEALEAFVRERMEVMGFKCSPIGSTRQPDGGIDLIACPVEAAPFPFLLAVQVKSHRGGRQSASPEVRDFLGAITGKPITAGVLVTNTTFSTDAKWFAAQHQQLLRLRDVHDLRRWVQDDFGIQEFWREIPSKLELRPGLVVDVHRQLLRDPGEAD